MSFRKATTKKGTLSSGSITSRSQNGQSLVNYGNALASAHRLDSYASIRGSLAHHNAFTPYDSSLKHQDLGHDKNDIIIDLFYNLDELIRQSKSRGHISDDTDYNNRKRVFEYNAGEILDSLSQYVSPSEIEELREFFQEHIDELLDDATKYNTFRLIYNDLKQKILNPLNNGPFE